MPSRATRRTALLLLLALVPALPAAEKSPVVEDNNAFAFDLYAQLRNREGNLFFSPFSVSTALAMTYAGAREKTAEEMAKTLHFTTEGKLLHPEFSRLIGDLNTRGKTQGYQLSVANALWGQKGKTPLPEFLKLTEANYGAGFREVDFAASEEARKTINQWVATNTQDKIKDLIAPGVLDESTRLVLANAIYFKGDWGNPFKKEATRPDDFKISAEKKVSVPMMNQQTPLDYVDDGDLQVVSKPYKGGDLSMVILLPKKVDGLVEIEKSVSVKALNGWLAKLHNEDVVLTLPKLTISADLELGDTLGAMGMPLAFETNRADFSGMNNKEPFFISKVIHKAFTHVDERGTEAAAATVVLMAPGSAAPADVKPPIIFKADHPFLFLIRDNRTGSILFLGRVMNPKL